MQLNRRSKNLLIRLRGHFLEYVLDRSDVQAVWKRYVDHDFVNQLAANTLPLDAFKHYMVQDYLYLVGWAPPMLLTHAARYP